MVVETDDAALLSLFQNKATRSEGFKGILNKYNQPIYYFLRKMDLNHNDADELLQDAFIEFWRTPISNRTGDYIRITLFHLIAVKCLGKTTREQLNSLTAQQLMIWVLKQQEDFDFAEIAQIVSIPVNDVRSMFKKSISLLTHQTTIKN